jgi:hypothetical protein
VNFDSDFDDAKEISTGDGGGEANLVLTKTRFFSPDEMIVCELCERRNAPTRFDCLYCGAPLPQSAQKPQEEASEISECRPALRPLEAHEFGFNVVFLPDGDAQPSQRMIEEAAEWLNLSAADLTKMLEAGAVLPLARSASAEEANFIAEKLNVLKLKVVVIADDILVSSPSPKRARRIIVGDDLTLAGTDTSTETRVSWSEVSLLVAGRIIVKQIETEERSTKNEVVEAREIVSDTLALDIHINRKDYDAAIRRIEARSFDFSCLSVGKKLIAAENFAALVETLAARAAGAIRDDSYDRVRRWLTNVWPLDNRKEARGLRRASLGRFNTEAVTYISNEEQFTRYSKLCREVELMRRKHEPR